jgi:hypothetical protein
MKFCSDTHYADPEGFNECLFDTRVARIKALAAAGFVPPAEIQGLSDEPFCYSLWEPGAVMTAMGKAVPEGLSQDDPVRFGRCMTELRNLRITAAGTAIGAARARQPAIDTSPSPLPRQSPATVAGSYRDTVPKDDHLLARCWGSL